MPMKFMSQTSSPVRSYFSSHFRNKANKSVNDRKRERTSSNSPTRQTHNSSKQSSHSTNNDNNHADYSYENIAASTNIRKRSKQADEQFISSNRTLIDDDLNNNKIIDDAFRRLFQLCQIELNRIKESFPYNKDGVLGRDAYTFNRVRRSLQSCRVNQQALSYRKSWRIFYT